MPDFNMRLQTPVRLERSLGALSFDSLEAAYLDVMRAIPATAAEMIGAGQDPMRCSYLICDVDGALLMEVPFTERLPQPPRRDGARPRAARSAVAEAQLLRSRAALLRRQAAVLVRDTSTQLARLALSHRTFARQISASPPSIGKLG